uniref:Ovule protein n=1 Tax=Mesocestoides corti TaxID=53468 RepID=A0A5K3ETV0_MESCO
MNGRLCLLFFTSRTSLFVTNHWVNKSVLPSCFINFVIWVLYTCSIFCIILLLLVNVFNTF